MDLNHGAVDNKPYSYMRAEASNKELVSTFEELLREVWIGIINAGNDSGPKPTDDCKLQDLTKKLNDMLLARRVSGNLSREEFVAVAMMSWFQVTLKTNTSIVKDLRADGESEEQRLYKIAQQVGVPATASRVAISKLRRTSRRSCSDSNGNLRGGLGRGCGFTPSASSRSRCADHHALVDHHWPRHESRKDCSRRRSPTTVVAGGDEVNAYGQWQRLHALYRQAKLRPRRGRGPRAAPIARCAMVAIPLRLRTDRGEAPFEDPVREAYVSVVQELYDEEFDNRSSSAESHVTCTRIRLRPFSGGRRSHRRAALLRFDR